MESFISFVFKEACKYIGNAVFQSQQGQIRGPASAAASPSTPNSTPSDNLGDIHVHVPINTSALHRSPEGTVFMVIDTSGSMAGSKIQQVTASVNDIISNSPSYVRFKVIVFHTEVRHLVTKKKTYLDMDRLNQGIKDSVGSRTALYDAWGKALNDIPYGARRLDFFHFLLFTDGEDNCSAMYDLQSMMDLTQQKIRRRNMKFSFIQAGKASPASNALKHLNKDHLRVYSVKDSADGIKFGFREVANTIQLQIQLHVNQRGQY